MFKELYKALTYKIGTAEHNMYLRSALATEEGLLLKRLITSVNIKGLKKPTPKRCRAFIDYDKVHSPMVVLIMLLETLKDIGDPKLQKEYVYNNVYGQNVEDANVMYALLRHNSFKSFSESVVVGLNPKAMRISAPTILVTPYIGRIHYNEDGEVLDVKYELDDLDAPPPKTVAHGVPTTLMLLGSKVYRVRREDFDILSGATPPPPNWRPPLNIVTAKSCVFGVDGGFSIPHIVIVNPTATTLTGLDVSKKEPYELVDITRLSRNKQGDITAVHGEYKGETLTIPVPPDFRYSVDRDVDLKKLPFKILYDTTAKEAVGIGTEQK